MDNGLFKAIMATVIGGTILLYLQYNYFDSIPVPVTIYVQPPPSVIPQQNPGPTKPEALDIDITTKFIGIGYKELTVSRTIKEIIITDTHTRNIEFELRELKKYLVAYHYLIGPYGEVKLLVAESNIAYHTGGRNKNSIGIGLIHVSGEEYSSLQLDSLISLLADIVNRHNVRLSMIRAKSQVDPKNKSDLFGAILNKIREQVKTRL